MGLKYTRSSSGSDFAGLTLAWSAFEIPVEEIKFPAGKFFSSNGKTASRAERASGSDLTVNARNNALYSAAPSASGRFVSGTSSQGRLKPRLRKAYVAATGSKMRARRSAAEAAWGVLFTPFGRSRHAQKDVQLTGPRRRDSDEPRAVRNASRSDADGAELAEALAYRSNLWIPAETVRAKTSASSVESLLPDRRQA